VAPGLQAAGGIDRELPLQTRHAFLSRSCAFAGFEKAEIFGADDRVRKPRSKKKEAPTPEATAALFKAARGERLELVVHLGLRLGLRKQEICALRYGDFDLLNQRLYIRRRVNRIPRRSLLVRSGAKMKDESEEQSVPLSNPTLWARLLQEHRDKQLAYAETHARTWVHARPDVPWAWLFTTRTGTVMDPREVLRWFKGIAIRAGQPDKVLHGLRHDCASLGIESGMSLWEVSQLLRHASTDVTSSVYGHITGKHETQLFSTVDAAVDAQLGLPLDADATG